MKILLAIVVLLNGKPIEFKDAQPFIKNGIVRVPLRAVFEKMGARVEYSAKSKLVDISSGETQIIVLSTERGNISTITNLHIVSRYIAVDTYHGVSVSKTKNHVFVPLRFFAQKLGANVNWNNATRTASITMKETQPPSTPSAIQAGKIEVRISSDKTSYRVGEAVNFTITATNQDDKPRELTFPSGQNFEVSIVPKDASTPVWNWSAGRMFTQMVRMKTLKPGHIWLDKVVWKQTDNDGKPAPRGEYSASARLTSDAPIEAPPLSIRLTN